MKITAIDVMLVDAHAADNPLWTPVLCRVHTDEGIYGDGEAGVAFAHGANAAFGALLDLAPMAIGYDPLDNEVVWDHLHKESFWAQNGGVAFSAAMSAIDIALWDIKGKFFGVPIYKLLGGKIRTSLRTYASQLQNGWGPVRDLARTSAQYAENARAAVAQGFDCVKVDFLAHRPDGGHYDHRETTGFLPPATLAVVRDRLSAVREAVGFEVDIAMENHAVLDAQSAVKVGVLAREFGVMFFEEPTNPTPKMAKLVHDAVGVPIALGERTFTRWEYVPYFENGSVQLIQPDAGTCGGITEAKKICDMAHAYDVAVQLHVCGTPLLTAASLNLEAVLPNFTIHEHHVNCLHEYNKRLAVHDYQPVNGHFEVPELPGIGNEISKYAIDNSKLVRVGAELR